jgi:hypothetical protein
MREMVGLHAIASPALNNRRAAAVAGGRSGMALADRRTQGDCHRKEGTMQVYSVPRPTVAWTDYIV